MASGQLILDRYRVIERAGQGGYATVLHAYDNVLKRDVAIKQLELSAADIQKAREKASMSTRRPVAILPDELGVDDDGGVLPGDPSFLDKRDEHISTRKSRTSAPRARGGSANGRKAPDGFWSAANAQGAESGGGAAAQGAGANGAIGAVIPYPARTQNFEDFAGGLPGMISGAGRAEIGSVGGDEVALELEDMDPIELWEHEDELPTMDVIAGNKSMVLPVLGTRSALGGGRNQGAGRNQGSNAADRELGLFTRAPRRNADRGSSLYGAGSSQPTDLDSSFYDNIPGVQEARSAAHLNDPNIVTVYDCVVQGNTVYVIMEYVEGKTLARVMDDLANDITLDMIAAVFQSVSHALEVAHDAKLLHLDIKPENVIINKKGDVKVTDFGLSTLMDSGGHGTTGGGTIGYMPLEQMRRRTLDVRTDEWALASLTYELLTGQNPFRANTLREAEVAIENAELVLPSQCWADIDESVDDVIFQALDPEPEERFDSVDEFSRGLMPVLGDVKAGKKQLVKVVQGPARVETQAEDEVRAGGGGLRALFGGLFGRGKRANAAGSSGAANAAASGTSAAVSRERQDRAERDRSGARDYRDSRSSARSENLAPAIPIIDRIGSRGSDILMRIFAGIAAVMIGVVSLLNCRLATSDAFGLLSSVPVAFWVILLIIAALAVLRPRFGMPAAYLAFCVMLMFNQAWALALCLLAAVGAWWWFIGRFNDQACLVVMLQPLFGSFGFAAISPIMAAILLDVREAALTTALAAASAIAFAALGTGDLAMWDIAASLLTSANPEIAGNNIMTVLGLTLSNFATWLVVASWVLAATVYSLFCRRGTKVFDVLGSILAVAFIIVGSIADVLLTNAPLMMFTLVCACVCGLAGVVLACLNVPDRVRLQEDEW